MSNTVVGFTISIDGIQSINQLNAEIKATKEAMNALDQSTEQGNKEFQDLSQTLGQLTAQQKALKKAQDDVNKSFLPEKAVGAYDALAAKLNKLRKEFKNAALDGSKTTEELDKMQKEIQQLDKTLKSVDGQVGQFQRNVGNYPKTLGRLTRSLNQTIPGFEAFSSQLRNSEGQLSGFGKALIGGFVAFQGAKLIGQAIQKLDQFISKINETKNTVAEFSGAYDEDLNTLTASTTALAETFNTDARTISAAAQSLSKNLGISFEEALKKLEGTLVEGRGNADDYLKTITEYPEAFQSASGEITEFSKKNMDAVNTNRELALSQIETAQRIEKSTGGISNFGKQLETGFFLVIAEIIDLFKPLTDSFSRLSTSFGKVFENLKIGGVQFNFLGVAVKFLLGPLTAIATLFPILLNALASWYDIVGNVIKQSPFLQSVFTNVGAVINSVIAVFNDLPNVFAGVVSALQQVGLSFVNTFQSLFLEAQIFAEQVKGVFGANVKSAIEDLRKQQAEIGKAGMTIAEAFSKGYNDAKKAGNVVQVEEEKKTKQRLLKVDVEALKKQQEAAAEGAKKLSEDRKKFQEDEEKNAKQRAALLSDLSAKAIEERIKNIQDGYQRELAEINNNFDQQKAGLQKQYDDLVLQAQQREKELIKTFGDGSKEVIQARKDNTIQIEAVAKAQAEILIQYEIQKNNAIDKVNSDENQKQLDKAKEQADKLKELRDFFLTEEIKFIQEKGEMTQLKNQENLNKALAQETDAKKEEQLMKLASEQETIDKIANIRNQIQAFNDAEAQLLDENGKLKVGITQDEYDKILLARQKLFTELSAEERKQTEDVEKNAAEQTKIRQDQFAQVLEYFKEGIDLIGEAFAVANERQQAAFDSDIERSQQRQEKLQEELENSTGLRRRFYQEQLDNEIANQAKLEKAKEDAIKRAAKKEKAIAIIQSLINTALAISKANTLVPPANIPAMIAAGIIGAAQTALIAAQPLAKGGVVGKLGGEVVQFANGGRVTSSGNIKPLSNGDNVLATLKTGEVVLNQDQQRRIGYSTLKAARIPNFAMGGVVGAPSGFLQDSLNRAGEEQNRFKVMQDLVLETQGRIDRLQVIYTASTDDDVEKGRNERKEIRATASF
jgi:predicted  nucleic acid-binding Zn-ribbon protein